MKFVFKPVVFILVLWGALFSTPIAQAWEKDKTYLITILHTNDHHGRFWHNDYGEYGLAAQKTVVDNIRREISQKGGSLLLLSGGDINTGVPESDLQKAKPDFLGMNEVGYDAMALGNHEFDNGLDVLREQERWANFPFLSANIYQTSTGKRLFKPYQIFEKQGVKIAVIGLTTNDTVKIGNPGYFDDIEFRVPAKEAKIVIDQLRQTEKPDIIIAATHMGHYDDANSGSNAPGDVAMARELPQGVLDMIVGGHSQNPVCMAAENRKQHDYVPGTPCAPDNQNGTWIVQAHEWGKYVGRADFEFRNGKLILKHYELIPINLKKKVTLPSGKTERLYYTKEIPQDTAVLALLSPFQEKAAHELNRKIGEVKGKLEGGRDYVRAQQTSMARVSLAGQKTRTKADFSVMSGGGIRDSIEEGEITYKNILKVQPFGNQLVYIDFTGEEALSYLTSVANMKIGSGAYAQFYHVSFTLEPDGSLSDVKISGEPLEPKKIYRMATLDFYGAGGDGYPKIDDHPNYVNTRFVDAYVLKEYIATHSPLNSVDYEPKDEIRSRIKMEMLSW